MTLLHLKNVVAFHQNCFTNTVVLLGVFNKPSKMQRISDNRTKKKTKQAHREILTQWGHERNLSSLTLYKCYESNICNLCSESLLQTESLTKDHLSLYIAWRFNFLPWLIFAHVIKKSFIDRSDFSYRMNFLSVHLFVVHFMDYLVQ